MVTTPLPSQTTSTTNGSSNGAQVTTVNTVAKIASGRTQPGATNWQVYGSDGIYVDVDTAAAQFTKTPIYVTSLGGDSNHWETTGASSVYSATATGFRIYIRWAKGGALTPGQANGSKWHINWIGIEPWLADGQATSTQTPSTATTTNQLPNVGCQNESQLRSINQDVPTQINFVNKTNSVVKVFWINHQGQRQFFRDLQPGQSFTQSTYVTHPWVVTDAQGTCLGVFQPERDRKDAIIEGSTTQLPKTPVVGQYYYLIPKCSGKTLAVYGLSQDNGAKVVQWDKAIQGNHQWRLEDAGNGYYYIVAKHSGKSLAVSGVSTADGATVVQWDKVAQANHQWRLEDAGDGYFYLVAKHSGKALDVPGQSTANGVNVQQYTKNQSNAQKWRFEPV